MKKSLVTFLVLILMLASFGIANASSDLNVLSWIGYVDQATIDAFTEETGINVIWSPMETPEDMMLKVSQAEGEGYDLILSSDYSLDILRKEGLLQPLDKEKLPNYANLDPFFLSQPYDPENEYVIPYMSGCTVIVYDPSYLSFEIKSFSDLWNEELEDSVVLLDNGRVIGGLTLKSMGKSINETDPEALAQMQEKLMSLYPNIRAFGDEATYSSMVTGDASAALTFATFAAMAYNDNPALEVVYPSEGLGFGVDGFVLSKASKNVDNAHLFLDYLMRAKVAAHNAQAQLYLCVNKAAQEFLSDEYLNNPAIKIPKDAFENAEIILDLGETSTTYQEIYTTFKLQ